MLPMCVNEIVTYVGKYNNYRFCKLSLIKSTTFLSSTMAVLKESKRKEVKELTVDNFLKHTVITEEEAIHIKSKRGYKVLVARRLRRCVNCFDTIF